MRPSYYTWPILTFIHSILIHLFYTIITDTITSLSNHKLIIPLSYFHHTSTILSSFVHHTFIILSSFVHHTFFILSSYVHHTSIILPSSLDIRSDNHVSWPSYNHLHHHTICINSNYIHPLITLNQYSRPIFVTNIRDQCNQNPFLHYLATLHQKKR